MSVLAIIPARYASSRLCGKPLLAETGRPLIQHVFEAVQAASRIERIVVATDDQRICDAVEAFGGQAVMTSPSHRSGTDRIAEAVGPEKLDLADDDIVINVQGDEPEIPARCVDKLVELIELADAPMATLAARLAAGRADDPNKVKVVLANDGSAMYFSRAKIPHYRDPADGRECEYLLHLGIYAYRVKLLKLLATLPPTPAEKAEKLEQLRALQYGYKIATAVVDYDGAGIDTPEDYAAFVARIKIKNRAATQTP